MSPNLSEKTKSAPGTKVLNSLQVGRGLAASAVVAHHASLSAYNTDKVDGFLPAVLQYGYLGVDFFFVLSGFIIYSSTYRHVPSLKWAQRYIESRFVRVYVPYLPVCLFMFAVYGFEIIQPGSERDWSYFASLTLVPSNTTTALNVAWTLRHEVVFYFLFALFFSLGRPLSGLFFWAAACLIFSYTWSYDKSWSFLLSPINVEFALGGFVAYLVLNDKEPSLYFCGIVSAALFVLFFSLGGERSQSLIIGSSIAFAIIPIIRLDTKGALDFPRLFVFLGNASYAVYLVHDLFISATARVLRGAGYYTITVAGIFLGVVSGILYHLFWEKPALRWARSFFRLPVHRFPLVSSKLLRNKAMKD